MRKQILILLIFTLIQESLPNSIVDFWRTVWQEEIATIVMATRLEERGRLKCARYFSNRNDADFHAGFFKITLKKVEKRLYAQLLS